MDLDSFTCSECLEEHKKMMEIHGYGYSYLGKEYDCHRHNKKRIETKKPDQYLNTGLKWTDGQPYERSRRMNHQIEIENEKFSKDMESSAYTSSLHHDENTWDILNQGLYNGFTQSSKREALDNKIADRELVQQKGFNPFLNDSNYVQDISNSDMYLKPMNTTLEREKNKTNNE